MIIARAPLRLPLGGGGTDLEFYATEFGGFVLSVAIDKYAYVTVLRPPIERGIRVKARINEYEERLDDIKNELVRECLRYAGVTERIQVTFSSDLSDGTGMGTSGAYAVALMAALHFVTRKPHAPKILAEAAAHVELELLKRPIGKHDQYMAAFGGLKLLCIAKDRSVAVVAPEISRQTMHDLKNNLMLFYTGTRRESSAVLGAQKEAAEKQGGKDVFEYYHAIKDIGVRIYETLVAGDVSRFGGFLHEHWQTKKRLAGGVSNPGFDHLYDEARDHGAIGGKLVGAGGGGLFLFFVPPRVQAAFSLFMQERGCEHVPFAFEPWGVELSMPFSPAVSLHAKS